VSSFSFFPAKFRQKEIFKIQKKEKKSDFGGFQSPEIRKLNVKIARFLYLVFIV